MKQGPFLTRLNNFLNAVFSLQTLKILLYIFKFITLAAMRVMYLAAGLFLASTKKRD